MERPPAIRHVYVLAAAVAAAAAFLTYFGVAHVTHHRGPAVPWLAVAAACFVTESFLVHFEHRRESHSISFSAVPLVVGLYTLPPLGLLLAVLAGSAAALGLVRRQAPFKLAINLASSWLETSLAILVFAALAPAHAVTIGAWPAAFAAAIVGGLSQAAVVTAAISVFQRRAEILVPPAVLGLVVSVANASLAIVAVTLIDAEPLALALLAAMLPVLLVSYRVYSSLREKHTNLANLYEFTTEMGRAMLDGRAAAVLLDQTRELMHAEQAWLIVDDREGATLRVRLDGRGGTVSEPCPPMIVEGPLLLSGEDGMAAPLIGPAGRLGTLVVGERSGDVRPFAAEDLPLFATLANHASVSLGNSQLVDQLREQATHAEHVALHDALTGLPNRVLFQIEVERRLERGGTAAVLLLDLNRFKDVNDTLGHPNGDLLLCEVGARLRTALRGGDLIARLGGDEFAVLLPDVAGEEAAVHAARGISAALERPFEIADVNVAVGVSIGVVVAPDHGNDPTLLLQRADIAMYTAKTDQTGVELYELSRDRHSTEALELVGELRDAIHSRALDVHYQPQIDLISGRVIGAEALVRWTHPTRGFVPPDEFIPVAEQAGLIAPLTQLVLEKALAECAAWRDSGKPVRISVNLSARSLLQASLADDVAAVLASSGVDASLLCLELTETSMMIDPRRTVETLHALRALGVTIAVDDFGTGHSSLAYLKQLPVGEIKIDKSFVLGMCNDRFDEAIVCSIVDLARHLLVPVVAEGVETAEIESRLRAAGCSLGQGYGFCRPIPAAAFQDWLNNLSDGRRITASP
jgi:diguanylate cyclase (GGDEF)-like protein